MEQDIKKELSTEEKKVEVEKMVDKLKKASKETKQKEVIIKGVSETVAQAINTVVHHIDGTKSQPQGMIQGATKQLGIIEVDLDLLTHVEKELATYNNTTKTYRDVVKRIESLSETRVKIEKFIEMHQKTVNYVDDTIAKIKSHIKETVGETTVEYEYDAPYFESLLDLAYVIFDLVPNKDGSVELKNKVKE